MNAWQIFFIVFGSILILLLAIFPPQLTMGTVKFLPLSEGFPVDWFRLFFLATVVIFFAILGFAVNKQEHK